MKYLVYVWYAGLFLILFPLSRTWFGPVFFGSVFIAYAWVKFKRGTW